MDESCQVHSLLNEIHDLQKERLVEYREWAARPIRLAEESVARQKAIGNLDKKALSAAAALIVLAAYPWWRIP